MFKCVIFFLTNLRFLRTMANITRLLRLLSHTVTKTLMSYTISTTDARLWSLNVSSISFQYNVYIYNIEEISIHRGVIKDRTRDNQQWNIDDSLKKTDNYSYLCLV